MELFIGSRPSDADVKKHVYREKWKDYSHEENTWETYEHVAESDPTLLENFTEQIQR
jgi:hypothetical protein